MNKHLAKYGNVLMKRQYCKMCRTYALIIDNVLQCCDRELDNDEPDKFKVMCQPIMKRKRLPLSVRQEIIKEQKNRCFYCNEKLNGYVVNNKLRVIKLRTHFDHINPFIYSFNNQDDNFVASCHICNGIKSNKVFNTIEEVKEHVQKRYKDRGYKAY